MTDVDYQSIPPQDLLAEANRALTDTGNAVAHGANITGDYTMRLLIAARGILDRHAPMDYAGLGQYPVCVKCGDQWPCVDVRAVFKVLAVGREDDLDGKTGER